ncbi:Bug family tripartite tricarboxylate transporter substrate binding protein [Sabulicella rubraurantiaca]|uniref:Bug family tripartite tricarboxylate transporter substrate binding protein n=1 Tax=Sabulicella rubraurantiaca TaxID=2811429 RepID=UPI001A97A2F1|nr:tripartite tricarboxylate transporter substrate-binding protein [Sabulicella rubraurantiaca]
MKRHITRRAAMLALPTACLAAPALAQSGFPSRPPRLIVNFGAGGAADTVARLVQPKMSEALGQSIVIENRTGAGGTIGAVTVARSEPDGYTVLFDSPGHIINPLLQPNIPINYETSFSYISGVTIQPWVWIVSSNGYAARDLQGFVNEARQRGETVIFGSSGIGSAGHLAGELLGQRTGLPMEHVPYRSGAEAGNDVAAGNLKVACITVSSALPAINAGKARYIASTGARRSVAVPDLPTFAESGFPGFDVTSWIGMFGPAGLPAELIGAWNRAIGTALRDDTVRARLSAAGFESDPTTPEEFAAKIARERVVLSESVRSWQNAARR